jgi:hypothetical protein
MFRLFICRLRTLRAAFKYVVTPSMDNAEPSDHAAKLKTWRFDVSTTSATGSLIGGYAATYGILVL